MVARYARITLRGRDELSRKDAFDLFIIELIRKSNIRLFNSTISEFMEILEQKTRQRFYNFTIGYRQYRYGPAPAAASPSWVAEQGVGRKWKIRDTLLLHFS